MSLPPSCAACGMLQQPDNLCRRHAPSPTTERREAAYWPRREPASRCGEGSTDQPIQCGACIYWWQPDSKPLDPPNAPVKLHTNPIWHVLPSPDRGPEWWAHSGLCVHHTASPASETQTYYPRVTHATLDGCGDGKMPEEPDEA
jgi:hypothetical protein